MSESSRRAWAAIYAAGLIALAVYAVYAAIWDTKTGDVVFGWLGVVGCAAAGVGSAGRARLAWGHSRTWFAVHVLQAVIGGLMALLFVALPA